MSEQKFKAAAFFDIVREELFRGSMTQTQVDGLLLLGTACKEAQLHPILEQTAYVFATSYHETAQTMQPVTEYGANPSMSYWPFVGRGHVQLTHKTNYEFQQNKLGHLGEEYKVLDDMERALIPHVSADICVLGMKDGDFTGKGLDSYIKPGSIDYVNARRIVNGTDKASQIAGYADIFERALRAGSEGMDIPVPPPPPVEGEPVKFTVTRVQVGENINYTHPDVRIAQSILTGNGYLLGESDGVAGPKFTGAVSDFQATVGLAVTGVVDAATWIELET